MSTHDKNRTLDFATWYRTKYHEVGLLFTRGELHEAFLAGQCAVTSAVGPKEWEWPVNTVGRLIDNLRTLPPGMPFYVSYFVEIDGKNVAKTTSPSCSRETVANGRIQKYDPTQQSLVIWAAQDARPASATNAQPEWRWCDSCRLKRLPDEQEACALRPCPFHLSRTDRTGQP